jgi:energy-coupling factor transporter ATP-binding protein EcfA2
VFDDFQICPYTGLRSFTEEESLYFKGREEHIDQATEQLQRNKFLMLTGASGDGKSSLVYAGIVPNARAGFLKAKYTQWCVADFRPERSPFKNLCRSVARQLDIANLATVESELQHGFSAMVDLYKNSRRYVDVDSTTWNQADASEQAAVKREAANLIVIVDQFEEFFTNPENYHSGVPSRDANLVVNIMLETARIALEEDLPIYVVFTMRSDYIGQCAAFRALPEYIGFSQFFVPRLNRAQLQQVIEEPATLSGNRITRRLTERLIHDIAEGVDQLPILQHALNQIWHAASSGADEMDLIHYAMVGGLSSEELPDQQLSVFNQWFNKLPDKVRACYRKPSLQNVLDTHANKLYESAAEGYRKTTGRTLSDQMAKEIIKKTFSCLTKIDQARAVRNRMTVHEIWSIVNRNDVDTESLAAILRVFREPGNTFIRPFITEDPGSVKLADDDVLDITHESLIRNWVLLEEWAEEEFNNYTISLDFEQQLGRWVESGKQGGYLLSIGPLTYFEDWYQKVAPNSHWIARYLPDEASQEEKLGKARAIRDNARQFLKQSARKHAVTRTIMQYGPGRLAAGLAIIALITLSSFALHNYWQRQNDQILDRIEAETYTIANSKNADFYFKSSLFAEQLKAGRFTVAELVNHIEDPIQKINVLARLNAILTVQGRQEPRQHIAATLRVADSVLSSMDIERLTVTQLTRLAKEMGYLRVAGGLSAFHNPNDAYIEYDRRNAMVAKRIVLHILKTQPEAFNDIASLNLLLEYAINKKVLSQDELRYVVATLSPFGKQSRSAWLNERYHVDRIDNRGFFDYGLKFNGLYQQLAYCYAALGNTAATLQCVDSLLKYRQNYYENDYTGIADNATNIATVFYAYDHPLQFDSFIRGYVARQGTTEIEFFQRLIGRSIVEEVVSSSFNEFQGLPRVNLNCQFADDEQLQFIFDHYRRVIEVNASSEDERNFLLALAYKDEALVRYNRAALAFETRDIDYYYQLFDEGLRHYNAVTPRYREEAIMTAGNGDTDQRQVKRKFLFIYPDLRSTFGPLEPRRYHGYYTTELFARYLLDKDLISTLYSGNDYIAIADWSEHYLYSYPYFYRGGSHIRRGADVDVLKRLGAVVSEQEQYRTGTYNVLNLLIGNGLADAGDPLSAVAYYDKIQPEPLASSIAGSGFGFLAFFEVAVACENLAVAKRVDKIYQLVSILKQPVNRSSIYAKAASRLFWTNPDDPVGIQLLDSAMAELGRVTNLSSGQPNRILIAEALALRNPVANTDAAYDIVRNIYNKLAPTVRISRAYALRNDLYGATQQIDPNSSDGDMASFLVQIVYATNSRSGEIAPEWKDFTQGYFFQLTRFLNYVDEGD